MKKYIKIILTIIVILIIMIIIFNIITHIIRYILRNMAIDLFKTMNENDVTYWADFGTLLGIYREGDIIFGDNDVDVCIIDNEKTHKKMSKVLETMSKKGYKTEKKSWSAYRIYKYSLFCDIYINKIDKDIYLGATGENSNIPVKFIGNPQWFKWDNINVKVPERLVDTLIWRYGDDFMTPKYGFKGRDS